MPPERRWMLAHGARLARRGAWCCRLGLTRFCLTLLSAGIFRGPRWFARAVSGGGESVASRIVNEVRKLPVEVRPVLRALWSQAKCFDAMADYLDALPEMSARAAAVTSLGDLPLVVLTGGHATAERVRQQDQIAHLSTCGRHLLARESHHWVQLDEPALVVAAIREVIGALTKSGKQALPAR
jgi:hypothetical protein